MSAVATVRRMYDAYAVGNIGGALDACDDAICFRWAVDEKAARFSGTHKGKDAFLARLQDLQETFEYNGFRTVSLFGEGDRVAAQIEMDLTHRGTGKRILVESAHLWTVSDGRATELVEYYDAAALAFLDAVD